MEDTEFSECGKRRSFQFLLTTFANVFRKIDADGFVLRFFGASCLLLKHDYSGSAAVAVVPRMHDLLAVGVFKVAADKKYVFSSEARDSRRRGDCL